MRNVILLLVLSAHHLFAAARPERIPQSISETRASSWYLEQYRNWSNYVELNPEDKIAWFELFKASSMATDKSVETQRIASEISNRFPESGESYWVQSILTGWTDEGVNQLEKALELLPQSSMLTERVMLAEIKGEDRSKMSIRLFDQKAIYPSLLNYSYNVLMSISPNGILFTKGQNTTVPIWVLQDVLNVRNDVRVLDLRLLEIDSYRQRMEESISMDLSGDLESIMKSNSNKNVFVALTIPDEELGDFEDDLYLTGLASMHKNKPFDNYALLRNNVEKNFLLDYLTMDFQSEPQASTGKSLESNYILPFFMIKQYYDKKRDKGRSAIWRDRINTIATRSNIAARVHLLLNNSGDKIDFVKTEIDIKELDKGLEKVKGNLYASRIEVKNSDYEFFLSYLSHNDYDELLKIADFDLEKYTGINKAFHFNYHYQQTNQKEDFGEYPVMDLSYEGARLYCEWLTLQYNQQEDRKFKKVKFRLPSRKEWTMAALGYVDFQSWDLEENVVKALPNSDSKAKDMTSYKIGDSDGIWYPWYHSGWDKFRKSIRNNHGCFLANVKTDEEVYCLSGIKGDGFRLTSPVGTYFSNDMGLYDVIGNVAEMTDEKGIAMGGSWDHPAEESTIVSINKYEERDPSVGFRLFMEVIEE